jgi:SAM-dependent methyltransferase
MARKRFDLDSKSLVVELASNDGYLLQYFVEQEIPVLGVEPAANVAAKATEKGVPTLVEFFGQDLARKMVKDGTRADLIVGNNVLAQVPGINDFLAGMEILLKPGGCITLEFPHLLRLIESNQFDTIYHEHFFYFSLTTIQKVFEANGLTLFDVDELPTHGGSLRVYARHSSDSAPPVSSAVHNLLQTEREKGVTSLDYYSSFARRVEETKRRLLTFLIKAKEEGKRVAGYGAPGKGNTLLNYCGIRSDLLSFTVDRSPFKRGMFLPGTHIPILAPEKIEAEKPDYVLILPWNLKDEIMNQLSFIRSWGGKFVVPIPEVQVLDGIDRTEATTAGTRS